VPDPYRMMSTPSLTDPTLVVMLAGWIDAGGAAQAAMEALESEVGTEVVAVFDPDTFIDFRARRPTMQLRDGVNSNLEWPQITLKAGRDRGGHDVLLLLGHEPDSAWHAFCAAVVTLAGALGVRMLVGLGAYPFAAPHTRPARLSITASSEEVAAGHRFLRSSIDVPAGVESALEAAFAGVGIPALGLWAQVPHYVANMPCPAASVALLEALHEVAGIVSEPVTLRNDATIQRQRLDELVAANDEHVAMVRQLETAYDELPPEAAAPQQLPTGDELAAELERYLREQGT
jgi:PAC2 family